LAYYKILRKVIYLFYSYTDAAVVSSWHTFRTSHWSCLIR